MGYLLLSCYFYSYNASKAFFLDPTVSLIVPMDSFDIIDSNKDFEDVFIFSFSMLFQLYLFSGYNGLSYVHL